MACLATAAAIRVRVVPTALETAGYTSQIHLVSWQYVDLCPAAFHMLTQLTIAPSAYVTKTLYYA